MRSSSHPISGNVDGKKLTLHLTSGAPSSGQWFEAIFHDPLTRVTSVTWSPPYVKLQAVYVNGRKFTASLRGLPLFRKGETLRVELVNDVPVEMNVNFEMAIVEN